MKKKKVEIVQDPENEVPTEIIAQEIISISRGVNALLSGRLKREAILTLIKDKSGVSKNVIGIVLNNLESLEKEWTIRK